MTAKPEAPAPEQIVSDLRDRCLSTSMDELDGITVEARCQVVDSDGTPVNMRGDTFGRGWQNAIVTEKVRMASAKFCPRDAAQPTRRTIQYVKAEPDTEPIRCNCHRKMRLIQ